MLELRVERKLKKVLGHVLRQAPDSTRCESSARVHRLLSLTGSRQNCGLPPGGKHLVEDILRKLVALHEEEACP